MIVRIDKQLLVAPELWNTDKLNVYALGWVVIGISPKPITEWKLRALHFEEVDCYQTEKEIVFKLPEILYNFYWLMDENTTYSLCGMTDSVLMFIERKENVQDKSSKKGRKLHRKHNGLSTRE